MYPVIGIGEMRLPMRKTLQVIEQEYVATAMFVSMMIIQCAGS